MSDENEDLSEMVGEGYSPVAPRPGMERRPDGSFAFAPGNQLWKLAAAAGLKPKLYTDPMELLEGVCGYFQWVLDNPLYEAKAVSYEGETEIVRIPKMRSCTLAGLCLFLGISRATWGEWRRGHSRPELADVVEYAEQYMYEQKFNGAASGLLNASIIGRDLGLVDKQQMTGPNGGPLHTINVEMTPEQAANAWQDMLAGGSSEPSKD